jgi:ribosomal protein L37E
MAKKSAHTVCRRCRNTFEGTGTLCSACAQKDNAPSTRPNSNKRGYDYSWRKIREQVLRDQGIPQAQWPLYAVDHNPPYNPEIEPDHTKYDLVPRLIEDHNSKTAREDTKRDQKGRFTGSMGRG